MWQNRRDSNPYKENQNLLCYRYTTVPRKLGGVSLVSDTVDARYAVTNHALP